MKGIVHTVLLLTILPTFAMAEGDSCSGITEQSVCNSTPGCGYTNNSCSPCGIGKYNDGSSGECKDCSNGPSGAYTTSGVTTSECPWELSCNANQYYDSNAKQCKSCPLNSTSTRFTVTDKTFQAFSINHCVCTVGYQLNGDACKPETYQCPAGQYLPQSTPSCRLCTQGYYCSGDSYTYSESQNQGITKCPAGSTSPEGSDEQKDCYMDSNTEFCDASGANCVSFGAIFDTPQINYNLD